MKTKTTQSKKLLNFEKVNDMVCSMGISRRPPFL